MNPSLRTARALALLVPASLLIGAWASQLIGGLHPCEMCHWQRWPHYAAVLLALGAVVLPRQARAFVPLAAIAILVSGAIGVFHAGVEYRWWDGITRCASTPTGGSGADLLRDIMATPLIRCDVAQWTLFGISLAGWNALFSLGGGIAIMVAWFKSFR